MKLKACISKSQTDCVNTSFNGWPPAFWSHQKYFSTIKSFHWNLFLPPVPHFCLLLIIFSNRFSTIPACGSSLIDYGEPVSWIRPRGLPASLSHLPPLTAPSIVIFHPDFLQGEKIIDSVVLVQCRPNIHWRADKTESVIMGFFGEGGLWQGLRQIWSFSALFTSCET